MPRLLKIAILLIGCVALVAGGIIVKFRTDDEWLFVGETLIWAEAGAYKDRVVRWNRPVTIGARGARSADLDILRGLVRELNVLLAETPVRVSIAQFQDSDVKIQFVPLAGLPEVARSDGLDYEAGDAGLAGVRHAPNGELQAAVVLIADETHGAERRRYVLEEVVQSFGPLNDARYFSDSIFYQSGAFGGVASRMSARDRKLIRFLYRYLNPGANRLDLALAYWRYWSSMTVPPSAGTGLTE